MTSFEQLRHLLRTHPQRRGTDDPLPRLMRRKPHQQDQQRRARSNSQYQKVIQNEMHNGKQYDDDRAAANALKHDLSLQGPARGDERRQDRPVKFGMCEGAGRHLQQPRLSAKNPLDRDDRDQRCEHPAIVPKRSGTLTRDDGLA